MRISQVKAKIMKAVTCLEIMLAAFIIIGIIVGVVDLIGYLGLIYATNPIDTYDIFQRFLGHILMLAVGVELVAMLIMHTPGSVLEVLLYAIARTMLIYSKGTMDFLIGIAAIAAIFAIRRFLFVYRISKGEDTNVFSADTTIHEINRAVGVNIPDSIGNTIGGVVFHISKEACRKAEEGVSYHVADARIKVVKMCGNIIERVAVEEYDEEQ